MDKFKEVEDKLRVLKGRLRRREISQTEFVETLKTLRLTDVEGRFWTIGIKTGKWYYYDGGKWVESLPPALSENKAICIYCGFENSLDAESCVRCGGGLGSADAFCPVCGFRLDDASSSCPRCTTQDPERFAETGPLPAAPPEEEGAGAVYVFRSVLPLSFAVYAGVLGAFLGILAGALTGATASFPDFVSRLPQFLVDIQGKMLGALIYAVLGAVLGFIVVGVIGLIAALLINLASDFVGGFRFRLSSVRKKPGRGGPA
ncbi:MAG: hypothetical protein JW742_01855 [Candidatus Aminicenantes bacterium]|nr:hypothetical protein [Candidatus Aminicenantes bacterium]